MNCQLLLLIVIYLRVQLVQSSSSSSGNHQQSSVTGRSRSYHKQPLFNKPFGLLNPSGCCPCNECCSCEPDYLDDEPVQPAIPVPTLPGVPLFNRYGSSSTSSTRKSLVVRRRYVRPNGALVVEVEEQPVSSTRSGLGGAVGNGGSSIFGGNGGLFSRFLPSALERSENSTRSKRVDLLELKSNSTTLFTKNSSQLIVSPSTISNNQSLITSNQKVKLPQ